MQFFRLKRTLLLAFIMLFNFNFAKALAQSFIEIKISENDLNEAIKEVELSGSERNTFSTRFLPDISVTVDWWIRDFRLDINRDQIIVIGKVHAENGGNTPFPFSYTNDVSVETSAHINENELLIDISSLQVPIYARNPFNGRKIELTKIDVANYLEEKKISVDLPFQDDYSVDIPEVGEKKLVLGNKNLQIESDYISITSDFSISNIE